jgi:hypothetical protein
MCVTGIYYHVSLNFFWVNRWIFMKLWTDVMPLEANILIPYCRCTRWGWVVSVMPQPRFTPGERTPSTRWIGVWVGLRAGLDAEDRRKILCPCQASLVDQSRVGHYQLSYPSSWIKVKLKKKNQMMYYISSPESSTWNKSFCVKILSLIRKKFEESTFSVTELFSSVISCRHVA